MFIQLRLLKTCLHWIIVEELFPLNVQNTMWKSYLPLVLMTKVEFVFPSNRKNYTECITFVLKTLMIL
jgi:hypothetical protein